MVYCYKYYIYFNVLICSELFVTVFTLIRFFFHVSCWYHTALPFEKSRCHNGYITKSYPPNVLSNVLLKNIDRQHTCHMKCQDMVSLQCVFSSVLQEHNAVRKICPTSCIYKVFLQPVSAFILSKFYYSSWLNWYISKSKLFEHLDNIIQLEEFFTFVASMFLSWLCIFICN